MAKKKGAKKKSRASRGADENYVVIQLPKLAWADYEQILDGGTNEGIQRIQSIVTAVLGSDPLFNIKGVTIVPKPDDFEATDPDSITIDEPYKC